MTYFLFDLSCPMTRANTETPSWAQPLKNFFNSHHLKMRQKKHRQTFQFTQHEIPSSLKKTRTTLCHMCWALWINAALEMRSSW